MHEIAIAALLLAILLAVLASGIWIAFSLLTVALVAMVFFTPAPAGTVMVTTMFSSMASWSLTAIPLFVWMAEILGRTRLSEQLFAGLAPWMSRLPGRLMHVNVVGCGIFAGVSGSSSATLLTVGRITGPELRKRGYDENMSIGTLAGSGTLGLLIPPSIVMIVYGEAAEVSVARLFVAGVLPGLLLISLFMGYIMIWALLNKDKTPSDDGARPGFLTMIYNSRQLLPVITLIFGIIGSIYSGIATPTEAAACGVAGAFIFLAIDRQLTWQTVRDSLIAATHTTCVITIIFACAAFLTVAMGFTGLPRAMAEWITGFGLGKYGLLAGLTLFFILLGCFLEGISIIVLTTSVIMPMVLAAKIDLIWFGIYLVMVIEIAQITPPVGFNLFVLQTMTGKNILEITRLATPFFLIMVLAIAIITAFPEIVTYLPSKMGR